MSGIDRVGTVALRAEPTTTTERGHGVSGIDRRLDSATNEQAADLLRCATPSTMIEALQILGRDLQKSEGTEAILNKKKHVEATRVRVEIAVARAAHEAEEKAESQSITDTLQTVAKVAAVAGAVASVVATGGASAPALIALSGTLVSTFAKDINKAAGGNELSANILTYGGAGLSLVGGGAALLASGTTTATATTSVVGKAASIATKAAAVVGATATGASAYTGYQAGLHGANETHALADEKSLRAQRKQMMREVELLIDTLKEVQKSFNTSLSALASARENEAASNLTLSAGIRA